MLGFRVHAVFVLPCNAIAAMTADLLHAVRVCLAAGVDILSDGLVRKGGPWASVVQSGAHAPLLLLLLLRCCCAHKHTRARLERLACVPGHVCCIAPSPEDASVHASCKEAHTDTVGYRTPM
jgi:hypothetical protein